MFAVGITTITAPGVAVITFFTGINFAVAAVRQRFGSVTKAPVTGFAGTALSNRFPL